MSSPHRSRGGTSSPSPHSQEGTAIAAQHHREGSNGGGEDTPSPMDTHLSSSIVIEVGNLDMAVTPITQQPATLSSAMTGPLCRGYSHQQSPAPCITVASPFGEESSVSTEDEEEDEEEFDLSLIAQAAVSAMITRSREEQQQHHHPHYDTPTTAKDGYHAVASMPHMHRGGHFLAAIEEEGVENVVPTTPLLSRPVESMGGNHQDKAPVTDTTEPASPSFALLPSNDCGVSGGVGSLGESAAMNVVVVPNHSNSAYPGVGWSLSIESPILSSSSATSPPTTPAAGSTGLGSTKPSWVDFGFVAPDLMARGMLQGGGGGAAGRSQSKLRRQSINAASLQYQQTSGSFAASTSECGGGGGGASLTFRPETSSTITGLEDLLNTATELFGTGSLWHQQQAAAANSTISMSSLSLSSTTPFSMPAIRYLQQVVSHSPSISTSVLNMATGNHRVLPGLEHLVRTFGHQSNSFSDSAACGTVSPTSSPGGVDPPKDATPPPSLVYLSRRQSPVASRQDHQPPSSPTSTIFPAKPGPVGQIQQDQLTASMQEMFTPITKLDEDEPLLAGSMSGLHNRRQHHHHHHHRALGGGDERDMSSNVTVFPASESQMFFSTSLNNGPLSPGSASEGDSLIHFWDHPSGGKNTRSHNNSLAFMRKHNTDNNGSNSSPMLTHLHYPLHDAPPPTYNSTEIGSDTANYHQQNHSNINHNDWVSIRNADTSAAPASIHFDPSAHLARFAPAFGLSESGGGDTTSNNNQKTYASPTPAARGRVESPNKEGVDRIVEGGDSFVNLSTRPHADLPTPPLSYSHTAPHCSSSLQPSGQHLNLVASHPSIVDGFVRVSKSNPQPSNPLHADSTATSTAPTAAASCTSTSFSSSGSHRDGDAFDGDLVGIHTHTGHSLNSVECYPTAAEEVRRSYREPPSGTHVPTSTSAFQFGGSSAGRVVDVGKSISSMTSSLAPPPPYLQFGRTPPPGGDCSSHLHIPPVPTPNHPPDCSSGDIRLDATQLQTAGSDAHSSFMDEDGFVATVLGRFSDDRSGGGGLLGGGLAPVLGLGGVYRNSQSPSNVINNNNICNACQPDTLLSTSLYHPLIADMSSDSIRQFPSTATLAPALYTNSPSSGARSVPSQVLSTSGLIRVPVHPLSPSAYDSRVVLFEPNIDAPHQHQTAQLGQFFITPQHQRSPPFIHSIDPCTVLAGSCSETDGAYSPTSNSLLCGRSILGPWVDVVAIPPTIIARQGPTTPAPMAASSGGTDKVEVGGEGPKTSSPVLVGGSIHGRRGSGGRHTFVVCTLFLKGLCDSLLRAAAQINDGTLQASADPLPLLKANDAGEEARSNTAAIAVTTPLDDQGLLSPKRYVPSASNVEERGGGCNSFNDDAPNKQLHTDNEEGDVQSSSSSSSSISNAVGLGRVVHLVALGGDDLVPTIDDHPSTTQSPSKRRQISAWVLEVLGASLEHFLQNQQHHQSDSIVDISSS